MAYFAFVSLIIGPSSDSDGIVAARPVLHSSADRPRLIFRRRSRFALQCAPGRRRYACPIDALTLGAPRDRSGGMLVFLIPLIILAGATSVGIAAEITQSHPSIAEPAATTEARPAPPPAQPKRVP
jgi:hypothetical protein